MQYIKYFFIFLIVLLLYNCNSIDSGRLQLEFQCIYFGIFDGNFEKVNEKLVVENVFMDYFLVNNGFVWVIYGQVWVIESMLIGSKVELVVYQVEVYEKNCWIINCINFEGYKVMEKVG